jgi:drug/metabolite transporter (DMT)-like permease
MWKREGDDGVKKNSLLPVLAAVVGNAFWGFSFLFARVALQETTPEILLAIRFMISFSLMNIPILLGRQKLQLKGKKLLPLLGLAIAEPIVFFLESYGILYTNATFAGVMVAVAPVFAIALAALVLKEYPSKRQLAFSALPVVGVVVMVLAGSSLGVVTPLGVVLMLGDCVVIAAYRLFNRWGSREFTPFERTYVVLFVCAAVFTAAAFVQVENAPSAYWAA